MCASQALFMTASKQAVKVLVEVSFSFSARRDADAIATCFVVVVADDVVVAGGGVHAHLDTCSKFLVQVQDAVLIPAPRSMPVHTPAVSPRWHFGEVKGAHEVSLAVHV